MKTRRWVPGLAAVLCFVAALGAGAQGPVARTIVINEVELNPDGLDRDAEWVELLNVGTEATDIAGWSVTYNYPDDGALVISTSSLVLQPGGRYVLRYVGLCLRNDARTVIRLLDAAGGVVDEAPALRDVADDGKTWQRIPDGGDPLVPLWLFRDATKNTPNT